MTTHLEELDQQIASEKIDTLLLEIRRNMLEADDEDIRAARWGHAVVAGKLLNELHKRVKADGGDWAATLCAFWPEETANGSIKLLMKAAKKFDRDPGSFPDAQRDH